MFIVEFAIDRFFLVAEAHQFIRHYRYYYRSKKSDAAFTFTLSEIAAAEAIRFLFICCMFRRKIKNVGRKRISV